MTVLGWHVASHDAVLCHDLGPLTHPELFAPSVTALYERVYARIAERQPRMAFVSQASKAAFQRLYGTGSPATVIYPPIRTGVAGSLPDYAVRCAVISSDSRHSELCASQHPPRRIF